MRLALLVADLSGNSVVRTYPIARVLERRHEVRVVGWRSGPDVFGPYRGEFAYDTRPLRNWPGFWADARRLAEGLRGVDAVYAFKPLLPSLGVALLARRLHGVRVILDVEDDELAFYGDVPLRDGLIHLAHVERPAGLLWTALVERLARRSDDVFVVSRALQQRFGGTVLPHGADTSFFDPSSLSGIEARRRLGLADRRYVTFTGTPLPHKGIEDLLGAVAKLGRSELKVLIVGSFGANGRFADSLRERFGPHLLILPPQPHAAMPTVLAASDIVALPQRHTRVAMTQVPGKVFEAMAMARPIIATAMSDLPEILDGCGWIVPPGRPEALAHALADVLDRPAAAAQRGAAARARCIERYSWDAMAEILEGRLAASAEMAGSRRRQEPSVRTG